ncbi:hypothetical protein DFH06DRAFT_1201002 [Mycena polygramma]|nr:hypothetical protein DFH06DRAFT_1201002 [Mycena polygramma]
MDPVLKKTAFISRAKLVSASRIKDIAIRKYGSEGALATHLKSKKDRVRMAYDQRIAAYDVAKAEQGRLEKSGNVVNPKNSEKLPKTRPKLPAILKDAPFTPQFYRYVSILPTNFLVADAGTGRLVPDRLVACKMCNVMANLRWEDIDDVQQKSEKPKWPELTLLGLIPAHELEEHYSGERDVCRYGCNYSDPNDDMGLILARCETCLNAEALETKAELVSGGPGGWEY